MIDGCCANLQPDLMNSFQRARSETRLVGRLAMVRFSSWFDEAVVLQLTMFAFAFAFWWTTREGSTASK